MTNLRELVHKHGWGDIADAPEPIDLGTPARIIEIEVETLREQRARLLREAATLVALDENYEVLFAKFLAEAMGGE